MPPLHYVSNSDLITDSAAPSSADLLATEASSLVSAGQISAKALDKGLQIGSYTVGEQPDTLLNGHPDIRY
ncbi:hypothetical protein F0P96_14140 [Hymenobacter busanensis]|uniref:Uncharacterized protein n=1 Tax=Hymenobacter busanensis TaxID=2607656 RepID=A0A7L5A0M4_9BACT|nr:hypothetical protein [Hymenobacter busanensis]KAA9331382.1 hypothetical protein F0P96_14140 [Hymenobacter busanensis]QHJ08535.1 hypothetical protein GUY19_15065 [Hymenobacter busanensis]